MRGGLVREAAVGAGAERGQDEAAGIGERMGSRGGDHAEHPGAARAGRGGKVAGLAVHREVAEQRERHRFLRVAGEEEIVEASERRGPLAAASWRSALPSAPG